MALDITTLSLDLLSRGSYGGAPWASAASAGSSSSQELASVGSDPSVGSAVNGFTPATFDGSFNYLIGAAAGGGGSVTFDTVVTVSAGTLSLLIFPTSAAADAGADFRIENPGIIGQEGGATTFGLGYASVGGTPSVTVALFDTALTYRELVVACPLNQWSLVQCKWNGTTLFMRVNNGAWDSVACGDMSNGAIDFNVGKNYNTARFTGSMLEVVASKTFLSDATCDAIGGYVQERYALALGFPTSEAWVAPRAFPGSDGGPLIAGPFGYFPGTPSFESARVAYTLAADAASFALSGADAGLRAQRLVQASAGSFALSGNATGLTAQRKLVAAAGSFALSGGSAGVLAQRKLTASSASFALSGSAARLLRGYPLAASSGSFALSGGAAVLRAARVLAAAAGAFALSGNTAGLRAARRVTASSGSFSLGGNAAGLFRSARLVAVAGTFALSGGAIGTPVTRRLAASSGAFALTGIDAGLRASRRLDAAAGAFALAGAVAGLRRASLLAVSSGSFALAGNAAGLRAQRRLSAEVGAFALAAPDVTLFHDGADAVLAAETGTFALAGGVAELRSSRLLAAAAGTFALEGSDVAFRRDRRLAAELGEIALTGHDAELLRGRTLVVLTGVFALDGSDVAFALARLILLGKLELLGAKPATKILLSAPESATSIALLGAASATRIALGAPAPSTSVELLVAAATRITLTLENVMTEPLHIGDTAKIDANFTVDGTPRDPTTIEVKVQSPSQQASNTSTTYLAPCPEIVQREDEDEEPIVGAWRFRIPCTEAGIWRGRCTTTGVAEGSQPFEFTVLPNAF